MSVPGPRPASPLTRGVSGSYRLALALTLAIVLVPQIASAGQLRLSWVDNSGGVASFRIQRKTGTAGTYAQLALVGPGLIAYTDTTVVNGTTYCYRVQAYTATGSSAYSKEACGSPATGLSLTVSKSGTGQGTVSSSPAGISCGTDCTQSYASGTVVTLSAAASSGSKFGGWSGGGCAGTGTCTLTGNTSVAVVATFTAITITLSVAVTGPGTVTSTPAGINCGSDCSEKYMSGTAVTLSAKPATGAHFLGWTGGGCTGTGTTGTTCSITLKAGTSVSAVFY
jgi:Divergent InlB B-repeat domain